MPTDPQVFSDLSGAKAFYDVEDQLNNHHRLSLHVAHFNTSTGVWDDANLASDWTDFKTFMEAWMTAVGNIMATGSVITFLEVLEVVGGTPVGPPLNVGTIAATSGTLAAGAGGPAGVIVANMHDDGFNAVRFLFPNPGAGYWLPAQKQVYNVLQVAGGNNFQIIVNTIGGSSVAPAKPHSPIRSHTGGVVLGPAVVTSILAKRLRRKYGLI